MSIRLIQWAFSPFNPVLSVDLEHGASFALGAARKSNDERLSSVLGLDEILNLELKVLVPHQSLFFLQAGVKYSLKRI